MEHGGPCLQSTFIFYIFLLHGIILLLLKIQQHKFHIYTNIFSIKNIVFFLTFSVLLADFHLLLSFSPVYPPSPSPPLLLHPHPTSSHCDIDRRFPRFRHHRAWMSLSTVVHGVCFTLKKCSMLWHSLGLKPLTRGSNVYSFLGRNGIISAWKNILFLDVWVSIKLNIPQISHWYISKLSKLELFELQMCCPFVFSTVVIGRKPDKFPS